MMPSDCKVIGTFSVWFLPADLGCNEMTPLNECYCCHYVADYSVKSLVRLSSRCIGEQGTRGRSKHCHGANADNTVIQVSTSSNSYSCR